MKSFQFVFKLNLGPVLREVYFKCRRFSLMEQQPLTPDPRRGPPRGLPRSPGHLRVIFGCRHGLSLQGEGAATPLQSQREILSRRETVKRPSLAPTPARHWGRRHPRVWSATDLLL